MSGQPGRRGAFDHVFCPHPGEFDDGFHPHSGEFDKKFFEKSNSGGSPGGGEMIAVGIDWYINTVWPTA